MVNFIGKKVPQGDEILNYTQLYLIAEHLT